MKYENSKEDSGLQLKQFVKTNFTCYLDLSSTTHEIRSLYYAQMKAHCPKIL